MGSFFNVLIDRLPRKQSIVFPASRCSDCGYRIPAYLNVPILSYILLKGKCRKCGAKIHWHHLVVEIATPLIYVILFYKYGLTGLFFKYALVSSFMIPIFFIDAFHKLVLHVTTFPLIITGLLLSLLPQMDVSFGNAGLSALTVFLLLLLIAWLFQIIRKKDGLGGGDIWLLTGVATYFGFMGIPWIVLFSCITAIMYFLVFVRNSDQEFVLGPFIAFASILWAIFGDFIGTRILAY